MRASGTDGSGEAGDRPAPTPAAAVLVRVFAHGPLWHRTLPPVPGDAPVTVTVSDRRLVADEDDAPPDRGGYRVTGVVSVLRPEGSGDVVDLLVTPELREQHPDWWAELAERASRIFDLRFGPVRKLLGPALRLHRGGQG